jgi:PIN domain nuclease of toxin-antitoxin system
VRYLLDTHVLLWSVAGASQLSAPVKQIIESADNVIFVSLISLWELRIKESLGKVTLPKNFYTGLEAAGFELLSMTLKHIQALGFLPLHHRDPFDRMLIVQANIEQMTLITKDDDIQKYDVSLLRA